MTSVYVEMSVEAHAQCIDLPSSLMLTSTDPGFFQLSLSQTWVKCTLSDSSRQVVALVIDLGQFGQHVKI